MSASGRVIAEFRRARRPMRLLGASGQLGYGIPAKSFAEGIARRPDLIGCDMGSIDIGPTYLGKGEMATAPESTRRDLRRVLTAARQLDVPLVIGSAGSAGAEPHLEATVAMLRDIARADGLRFRMAVIPADIPRPYLLDAAHAGRIESFDDMQALTDADVTDAAHIVGQMGMGPFRKALEADVDVIVAGRACDTAIFASLPALLGFPVGLAMHMAKIIECGSLCCVPGGRDPILAELDEDGFVLESMNPDRRATPTSVAAHSLYEQSDPFTVIEPDGALDLAHASYVAVDERRARVSGAQWRDSASPTIKLEGALKIGERAVLLCGSADPRFIAQCKDLLPRSRTWCATWSARTGRRITRCGSGSTASMACAWSCRRTNRRRAKCSSWASASRRRASAHPRWFAPASSSCCTTAIPGVFPPPAMLRFRSRHPRYRSDRPIASTCTTCCTWTIRTHCSRCGSKRCSIALRGHTRHRPWLEVSASHGGSRW
jgi:hypothetical protein